MIIARWESRTGKHYVVLEKFETGGYSYRAPGAGGTFYAVNNDEAIEALEIKITAGYFLPDAHKSRMQRVI